MKGFLVNIHTVDIEHYRACPHKRPAVGRSRYPGIDEDHLPANVLFKVDKQVGAVEPFWLLG